MEDRENGQLILQEAAYKEPTDLTGLCHNAPVWELPRLRKGQFFATLYNSRELSNTEAMFTVAQKSHV